ncbi:MAG: FtsX-like permease family protein, partial [Planctomycetes bacterium]|nr:FtsX-like permease family protein [Planctomycetota bacterium]
LEPTELASSGLDRPAAGGRIAVAVATMLAFLCCAFIVTTAMTTALAEQQRLFAIARCIGATRAHIFLGQVMAGGVLCFVSGAIGVPVGVALTAIAVGWYSALLPAGVALSWTGIALAVAGATAAGIGGALFPAWKASRVSPLEALAVHARAASRRGILAAACIGAACLGAQLLLLLIPDRDSRFAWYILLGLPLLHVGWFVLAVPILRCISGVLAPTLERTLALPRGLLVGSLAATPWRFGLIAGALMVGVAILVSTWSNGAAILSDISERIRFGDAFAFKTSGFNREEVERMRMLPGVQSSAAVGYLPVRVLGEQVIGLDGLSTPNVVCIGFDSQPFLAMNRLEWIAGDPERAAQRLRDGDAVLVAKEFLLARGVTVGDRVQLGTTASNHSFEVVGVVGAAGLDVATQFFGIRSLYMDHAVSCVFMDFQAVERFFGTREAYLVQIEIAADAEDADETLLAEHVESAAPGAVFASGRGIRREILRIGGLMMTISSVVAVAAMSLASLAAAGVIAAGIATRARELGVLQAVGAGRSTLRALILGESLLVGTAAGVTGTLFGLQLAWMGVRSYREMAGMELSFNIQPLVIAAALSAVCAVSLLAALPSVRRLLQHEPRELLSAGAGLATRRRVRREEYPKAT